MKNKSLILGCLLYVCAIVILFAYAILECRADLHFLPSFNLRPLDRVLFLLLAVIFMYFGALALSKNSDAKTRRTIFRINLIAWLLLYGILLITLTLYDDYSYRDNLGKLEYYAVQRYNFTPFRMINNYISKFHHHSISFEIFSYNIIGNIIALMPLSFLLPLLFQSQRHFLIFLTTILAITIAIEAIQYITAAGTCDVDDIILNTFGACLAYFIFRLPFIETKLQQLFFQAPSDKNT